ncbi:MAG: ATP-grasp domain-containing protein [Candidatus Bathyarchaeota archaeon]|nr:ATP-grasp domain-containing protein [Candidatus Bathyarchaeota archaeon]
MKLLVYEFASGGGFAGNPLQPSILSEGFGMLRTIIADFKAAGYSVTTILDARLAALNPPLQADHTLKVTSFQQAQETLCKLCESSDAAYVIAPESNQTLRSLIASVEQTTTFSLNCRAAAVETVADKAKLLARVQALGLNTPATIVANALDDIAEIKQDIRGSLEYPVVVKAFDGVGCAGLSVVKNEPQIDRAVAKVVHESSAKCFMAQELIQGTAASVSLLVTENDALPISLNRQNVSLKTPEESSVYNGGQVPFDSLLKQEALAAAQTVAKAFKGLRGYVGVDLILTHEKPVIIEVNPRLTTSYVGLRSVLDFNSAQAMIDAVVKNELPRNNQNKRYAVFSKVNTPKPTAAALQEICGLNSVVSPPFPVPNNNTACALVLSCAPTLEAATTKLREAKKSLHRIIRRRG